MRDYNCSIPYAAGVTRFDFLGEFLLNCGIGVDSVTLLNISILGMGLGSVVGG